MRIAIVDHLCVPLPIQFELVAHFSEGLAEGEGLGSNLLRVAQSTPVAGWEIGRNGRHDPPRRVAGQLDPAREAHH
jgi:hypothetical protein